jgi:hypothetical protein
MSEKFVWRDHDAHGAESAERRGLQLFVEPGGEHGWQWDALTKAGETVASGGASSSDIAKQAAEAFANAARPRPLHPRRRSAGRR